MTIFKKTDGMNNRGTVGLKTKRLILRRFTMDDVQSVFENYGSDPLVNRYISFAPCAELESAKRFIQMHIDQYDTNPEFYGWAIVLGTDVIGSIGLFNVDEDADQAELGYSIGSKWWGNGYTTEAAKEVLRFAFDEIGVHRIYASHHRDNLASGKVLSKIGMEYEGTMRDGQKNTDGSFADLKLYGILEQDWRKHYAE